MRTALLLILLAATLGAVHFLWDRPDKVPDEREYPVEAMDTQVLLLVDSADPYAGRVAAQARAALHRARMPFREHDVQSGDPLPGLDSLGAVLTIVERLGLVSDADVARLEAFVEAGGGLAVLYRGWSARTAPLLGFASAARPAFVFEPEALAMTVPLMPGGDGLRLRPEILSSLDARAQPGCTVLAERQTAEGATTGPAAWVCDRGAGRVAFWNVSALSGKEFRGHVLQTLALVYPEHARPVARWAVMFLDDFTSPAPNAKLEPVWSRYGQTPAQFYAETWYPDMVRLAEQTGLVYTSTVIYAYNGRTTPPFRFNEWLNGHIVVRGETVPYSPWMANQDARRSEQALHGYNHQSLQLSRWGSRESMVLALQAARQRWELEGVAPLPTTYVPPQNYIDSVGVSALREAFPEFRTIAGLYTGRFEDGADREFGPEPWDPELYALPRSTSGFILTDNQRLKMLTVLHTIGAWNHFVHPDEVYANEDREATYREAGLSSPSEIGWDHDGEGFYPAFVEWVAFVREHYPWLQFVRADEAADRMRAFDRLQTRWASSRADGRRRLDVSASRAGQTFYVWARPGERLGAVEGGTVLDVWEGGALTQIVVEASGPRFSVEFEPEIPS